MEAAAPSANVSNVTSVAAQSFARREASRKPAPSLRLLIGVAAVGFSVLYLVSDLIELAEGGFSTPQLWLTYVSEAAIPLFVPGIYAMQRPRIGRLGLLAAVGYAYAFVFFTGTVLYAIVEHTPDWSALTDAMGSWITVHSVLMLAAGLAFGLAVIRAGVLPRWTGASLIAGMLLMLVAATLPDAAQTTAAAVRDIAFVGMGAALIRLGRARSAG